MLINEVIEPAGKVKFIFRNGRTNEIIRISEYENLVVNVCKNMIAARLAGGSGNCDITYGAVGTGGAVSPAVGNTTLDTEDTRKAVAAATASSNSVSLSVFYSTAEANGTLTEFAWFGQGATAAADSGVMINHVIITETKTSSETMTVEGTFTIS